MITQDTAKTTVIVDGKQGINELGKLEMEANEYAQALKTMRKGTSNFINTTKKLNEVNKRIKTMRNELGTTGMTMQQLRKHARDLKREMDTSTTVGTKRYNQLKTKLIEVNQVIRQQRREVAGMQTMWTRGMKQIGSVAATYFGVFQVIQFFRNFINTFKEYQAANSKLSGILRVQYKDTFQLRKQQEELGKATAFSASQVANAQIELAKLGKTQEEIIAMTPAILDGAVAMGVEMASAAELVAGQLNAFNLEATETRRVVDVLSKSTQISAFDFERLHTALAIVGPAAKASNASLEETIAILSAAIDANVDASSAGTALRNIYIDLADNGMTLNEAMTQIHESQNKLTDANTLFGKRGAVVATIIAEQSDKIRENTQELNEASGAAKKFADQQLDNLSGDLVLLQSAWEGFVLSVENGDGIISKVLRSMAKAVTNILNLISGESDPSKGLRGQLLDLYNDAIAAEKPLENLNRLLEEGEITRMQYDAVKNRVVKKIEFDPGAPFGPSPIPGFVIPGRKEDQNPKKAKPTDDQLKAYEEYVQKLMRLREELDLFLLDSEKEEIARVVLKYEKLKEEAESFYKEGVISKQKYEETVAGLQVSMAQELDEFERRRTEENNRKAKEQREKEIKEEKRLLEEKKDIQMAIDREGMSEEELEISRATEHYDALIALAEEHGLDIVSLEQKKAQAIAKIQEDYREKERQARWDAANDISQDIASSLQSLANLYEGHSKQSIENQRKLANASIIASNIVVAAEQAQALSRAINAAVAAGSVTGPAAPFVIPGLIASLMATVLSAFASIKSNNQGAKQAKKSLKESNSEPRLSFYHGNLDGGNTPIGMRDKYGPLVGFAGGGGLHGGEGIIPAYARHDPEVINAEALIAAKAKGYSLSRSGEASRMNHSVSLDSERFAAAVEVFSELVTVLRENGIQAQLNDDTLLKGNQRLTRFFQSKNRGKF